MPAHDRHFPLSDQKINQYQLEESRELNNAFPEALKEPILRRVQFTTVSRIDNLGRSIPAQFA